MPARYFFQWYCFLRDNCFIESIYKNDFRKYDDADLFLALIKIL